jgi:hypothetical protein
MDTSIRSISASTPSPRRSAISVGALPNQRESGGRSLIVTAEPVRRRRQPFTS